jgi:hypothetical protein
MHVQIALDCVVSRGRMQMKIRVLLIAGALLSLGSQAAKAGTVTLTFGGLEDNEQILNYFNGGLGGNGSGPGPSDGIVFGSDAMAIIADANGGSGNFANAPNGDTTTMYFLSGAGDVMNVAAGFTTGFSFFYSAINLPGTVNVYSGLDDTGTLLASLTLPVTPEILPAPDGGREVFDNWAPVGVTFSGTAESVDFTGTANEIGFDEITLGSETPGGTAPTPEPSTLLSLGIGLIALLAFGRHKIARAS